MSEVLTWTQDDASNFWNFYAHGNWISAEKLLQGRKNLLVDFCALAVDRLAQARTYFPKDAPSRRPVAAMLKKLRALSSPKPSTPSMFGDRA